MPEGSRALVLPDLLDTGIHNLLTLSRLEAFREHVFLCFSYNARSSRFGFHMNVGNTSPELVGAATCRVHRRVAFGRVLQVYVHLSQGRLFGAVCDSASGHHFDAVGVASGEPGRPWGACPTGRWRASIGRTQVAGRRFCELPPGIGLSDLLVAFSSHSNREAAPLDYSGGLDHLRRPYAEPAAAAPSWSPAQPGF